MGTAGSELGRCSTSSVASPAESLSLSRRRAAPWTTSPIDEATLVRLRTWAVHHFKTACAVACQFGKVPVPLLTSPYGPRRRATCLWAHGREVALRKLAQDILGPWFLRLSCRGTVRASGGSLSDWIRSGRCLTSVSSGEIVVCILGGPGVWERRCGGASRPRGQRLTAPDDASGALPALTFACTTDIDGWPRSVARFQRLIRLLAPLATGAVAERYDHTAGA
jgi:hypothetical protein